MQITSSFRPVLARSSQQTPPAPAPEPPQQEDDGPGIGSKIGEYAKLGGIMAVCGGVGYLGSAAHSIPYVGPVISGGVGALAGASAGATVAMALPGERIKTGAVLGAIGGAILGSSSGGHVATNVLMAAGAATAPYGLLLAVFSGAS